MAAATEGGSRFAAATAGLWASLVALAAALVITGFVWPGGADADVPEGAPVRLRLPELHRTTPVVPIKLEGNVLDPPRNVKQVGWWRGSAKPGARQGQTVITGHTVHTGGGSLNRLDHLQVDQRVTVITTKARISYEVDEVEVLSRRELAEQAPELFGQDHGDGRLVLVTCTDWNGREYESNVVVIAHRYAAQERTPAKAGG